jgi:hypothetical protein
VQLHPEFADAQHQLGLVQLALGDLAAGFAAYEWRWRSTTFLTSQLPRHRQILQWDGRSLQGQSILLWTENSIGETLQLLRYIPLVAQQGGRVVVECPASLVGLVAGIAGVTQAISRGAELPPCDWQLSLPSLPRYLATADGTIPLPAPPYLRPGKAKDLRQSSPDRHQHIGIAWADRHQADTTPAVALATLRPLLDHPSTIVWSLQIQPTLEELEALGPALRTLDTDLSDFAELAAAIAQLDLVITTDSTLAHLAGALGQPAWLLVPEAADWVWGDDRAETPWYPSVRLFRMSELEGWERAIGNVRADRAILQPELEP